MFTRLTGFTAACLVISLLQGIPLAYGNAHLQETAYKKQRAMYQKALVALEKGATQSFRNHADQLKDYPLYPYLDYFFILRYISKTPQSEIDRFLQTYSDTPLAPRLQGHWQRSLARRKKWSEFLANYEPRGNANLDCYYYWATYLAGDKDKAFQGASALWNVGKSQDKACDPLFAKWKRSEHFNEDIAWQRTLKAIENRKLQLTIYLERFISEDQREVVQEWRRTYRTPSRLKNIDRYLKSGADYRPAIISGFKRLVRKDYQLAHQLWPEYEAAFNFAPADKAELFNYFARNMAVNYYPEAENWLDKALLFPDQQELLDYGIRHALRDFDWQRVKQWISMLSPAERGSAQWRYWEAKAEQVIEEYNSPLVRFSADMAEESEVDEFTVAEHFNILDIHQRFINALSHSDHFFELLPDYSASLLDNGFTPTELFESLTYERGFYGFLASEKSKKPLPLNHAASILPEDRLNKILQHPGVIRARELYLVKETTYAHREWYAAIQSMTLEQRGAAAHLAHLWGWHNQAIIAASRSDIHDNLELRFPKAYYETVSSHAQSRGLASDWVYSLIRQESAFSAGAKSGVGAMGIMQIMPSTARQVSRSIGTPLKSNYQLLDPHHNIKLGTAYLGQLLNKFNGNLVLATAAYNAGPYRAKRWQPENHAMDGDIWIETIPIHETRNYVKNIFTYQAIYRHNLGLEPRLSDSLITIQPKKNTAIATN